MFRLETLIIFVSCFELVISFRGVHKVINHRDISEQCRRRVMPSVFLGWQVMGAHARILQFSRLELPYSCFISVRTESGSNMVMVIQLHAANGLRNSCSMNGEQLLIYEMGETFGGYWGPLPDSVMKRERPQSKFYTLKTTEATVSTVETSSEEESEEITESTSTQSDLIQKATLGDYVEIEVPIVDFQIKSVPGKPELPNAGESSPGFDFFENVAPVPGELYETSILPLVQFSVKQQPRGHSGVDDAPKYQLDLVEEFTPDMRLPHLNRNISQKRKSKHKYQANRRLNFKKNKTLMESKGYFDRHEVLPSTRRMYYATTKYVFPTINSRNSQEKLKNGYDSWQAIEALMNKLNKTVDNGMNEDSITLSEHDESFLEKISRLDLNISAYLLPNLTDFTFTSNNDSNSKRTSLPTKPTRELFTSRPSEILSTSYKNIKTITDATTNQMTTEVNQITTNQNKSTTHEKSAATVSEQKTVELETTHTDLILKGTVSNNDAESTSSDDDFQIKIFESTAETHNIPKDNGKVPTGSLVDHESWENVVQAAPEMAVLLNQTVAYDTHTKNETDAITHELNETRHKNKISKQKKRDIQAIFIENAQPHSLTTMKSVDTTTKASFEMVDMQEFAQLVELHDDEVGGRVALRYLRQYVGPAGFNLCDERTFTRGHVYLFNSSRIVLAITNFTLTRMTIILTAARTLMSGESRCPSSQIECLVSGARACLDSMVACDGVPNCGSYEIYDEDRLRCGKASGLQHNVYLAAFTFIAVILTALYAVHYWLKRCVPKVADAFFVYTEGVENVLYLDTIMRSPHDDYEVDTSSKMVFHSNIFDMDVMDEIAEKPDINACMRFFRKCSFCCRKKHRKIERDDHERERNPEIEMKRMYSFTELEIRRMLEAVKHISVQTGDSLETNYLDYIERKKRDDHSAKMQAKTGVENTTIESPVIIRDSLLTLEEPLPEQHADELSLLKFFRDARSDTIGSVSNQDFLLNTKSQRESREIISEEETEVRNFAYDEIDQAQPGPSRRSKAKKKSGPLHHVQKHLRFDSVTTTIPAAIIDDDEDDDDDDEHDHLTVSRRRSINIGKGRNQRSQALDTIEEDDDNRSKDTGKEHRHFWESRKSKKKTHVSLR